MLQIKLCVLICILDKFSYFFAQNIQRFEVIFRVWLVENDKKVGGVPFFYKPMDPI